MKRKMDWPVTEGRNSRKDNRDSGVFFLMNKKEWSVS